MSMVAYITAAPGDGVAALPFRVSICTDMGAARAAWETLTGEAPHSGYQRHAWQDAFLRHLGVGTLPCIAILTDAADRPQALLPLSVTHRRGIAVASFIGAKHANFAMGLWRPAFARSLDTTMLRALFEEVARQAPMRIDLFALCHQPAIWQGHRNPLAALPHRPSPSFGHHLSLDLDAEAVLARVVSPDSRKKLRKKERALGAEAPVRFVVARDLATITRFTDAFLGYKALRFAELGIANVFAARGTRDFIIEAASGVDPALELCALMVGDEPVALFGGTVARGRYSGMFNAMAPGPQQRHSPGELLLHHLIRHCCERGLTVLDLGVGEAAYKSHICDGTDTLFDQTIPVTLKGRVAALAMDLVCKAKRQVKQSGTLWPMVVKLRRLRGRRS